MRKGWLALAGVLGALGLAMYFVFTAVRFSGFLCLCGALFFLLWGFLEARREKKAVRVLRRVLLAGVALGLAAFAVLETMVIRGGRTDWDREPAAVVVLGAGVNGRSPSLSLAVRLRACLDYIADKPEVPIVVTGGQGPGEQITEARCMADWLVAHGVDEGRILLEERAENTAENVAFSKAILAEAGVDPQAPVAVVSADYHLCRAGLLWGEGFVPVAAEMPGRYLPLTVNYFIREAFGVAALMVGFTGR